MIPWIIKSTYLLCVSILTLFLGYINFLVFYNQFPVPFIAIFTIGIAGLMILGMRYIKTWISSKEMNTIFCDVNEHKITISRPEQRDREI